MSVSKAEMLECFDCLTSVKECPSAGCYVDQRKRLEIINAIRRLISRPAPSVTEEIWFCPKSKEGYLLLSEAGRTEGDVEFYSGPFMQGEKIVRIAVREVGVTVEEPKP